MSVVTAFLRSIHFRLGLGAMTLGLAVFGAGFVAGCGSEPNQSDPGERAELGEERIRLHIGISDRTGQRPPSEQFAIEAPGVELWRPSFKFGRAQRQFAAFPVGKDYEFYIYPSGEDGPRWRIPFSMKPGMRSGMATSKTHVEIYDDSIVAVGPAVPEGRVTIGRKGSSPTLGP